MYLGFWLLVFDSARPAPVAPSVFVELAMASAPSELTDAAADAEIAASAGIADLVAAAVDVEIAVAAGWAELD